MTYLPGGGGGGASNLSQAADVAINNIQDGHILSWDDSLDVWSNEGLDTIVSDTVDTAVSAALVNKVTNRGAWATSTAYNTADMVVFNGAPYVANQNHASGSNFDPTKWQALIVDGFRGAWQTTTAYSVGDLVVYNGGIYEATTGHTSAGTFNALMWQAVGASALLSLSDVDSTDIQPGDVLIYNGAQMVPTQSGTIFRSQTGGPLSPAGTSYEDIPGCGMTIEDLPVGTLLMVMAEATVSVVTSSIQVGLTISGISTMQLLSTTATTPTRLLTLAGNTNGTTSEASSTFRTFPIAAAGDVTVTLRSKLGTVGNGGVAENARLWVIVIEPSSL